MVQLDFFGEVRYCFSYYFRIRHCKDYYEILNLKKDATEAQLKREYRKLALQLHPDKCRAPGATEAFKGALLFHSLSFLFVSSFEGFRLTDLGILLYSITISSVIDWLTVWLQTSILSG